MDAGKSIRGAGAFALPPFAGAGINPGAPDSGFLLPPGAFHFARVHYDIVDIDYTEIFLEIGANEIGLAAPSTIRLGVGDPPVIVDTTGGNTAGLRSLLPEAFTFVPEPAGACLLGLGVISLISCSRRRLRR
jgi:hypothetical protein